MGERDDRAAVGGEAHRMLAQDSRDAVSCATGILMERYGCDVVSATERLAAWSRDTDIDVSLIAAWLVSDLSATWNGGTSDHH